MRMLREPGVARLLRGWRRGRALEKLGRKAILAASAVGLVTAPGRAVAELVAAGRAIQRAWLTATKLGLGIQPHTSALYLFARAFGGDAAAFVPEELEELSQLKARFDAVLRSRALPVFMFRVFPGCEPPLAHCADRWRRSSGGRDVAAPGGEGRQARSPVTTMAVASSLTAPPSLTWT